MLFDILFIVLVIAYSFASINIDAWLTISLLGFSSETPEFFLRNPKAYDLVRGVLFVGAAATAIFAASLQTFVALAVLAAAWLAAGKIGRKKGFENYRSVMREMIEFAETDEERRRYQNEANKTDQELLDETQKILKPV